MNVCLLIDSLGSGGAERSTAVLLPYLRASGITTSVVTLYRAPDGSEGEVRAAGFPVRVLQSGSFFGRVFELRRIIKRERPDILHTALFQSDQIGRLAAIGTRTKLISSLVNMPRIPKPTWSSTPAPWKIRVVNFADLVTSHAFVDQFHAVSAGVADAFVEQYHIRKKKITVVERGRDPQELGDPTEARRSRVRNNLGIDEAAEVVFTAGRHDAQKAHVDLIRAVETLVATRPNILLLIAGRTGEATDELAQQIESVAGLSRHVRVLGFRSDVPDLLVAADVMALPSRFEGTAGIALEAMALGTPIVATALPGMNGILKHEVNSLIVPVGDPEAMAQSLVRILDDECLASALSTAAHRDFVERFTVDRSVSQMSAMYSNVSASR